MKKRQATRQTGGVIAPEETRQRVRALIEREGATAAARILKLGREGLMRLAAGAEVRRGTLMLANVGLNALARGAA